MAAYNYHGQCPLKRGEFRLVRLHRGEGNAELECNLLKRTLPSDDMPESDLFGEVVSAPNPEPYEALSYTWGPKGENCHIKILEADESHAMEIRPNLKAALLRFRLPRSHRYLWVDALCVDQDNQEEKSTQVSMMFRIFDTAESVCVWLGEEADGSARAMEFIRCRLKPDNFDKLVEDQSLSEEWVALCALIRRPWFSRRWIIQEIALAKKATVFCGGSNVDWEEFADAVSLLVHSKENVRRLLRKSKDYSDHPDYLGDVSESAAARLIDASDNMFRKSEKGQILERLLSLEELMSSLSAFEASDARDVLYAILWLARDARPGFKGTFPTSDDTTNEWPRRLSVSSDFPTSPTSGADSLDTQLRALAHVTEGRKRALSDTTSNETPHKRVNGTENLDIPQISISYVNSRANETTGDRLVRMANSPTDQREPLNPIVTNGHPFRTSILEISPTQGSVDSNLSVRRDSIGRQGFLAIKAAKTLRERAKKNSIPVDYKKSVLQVCKDVLRFIFTQSNSLDMMCRPWAPSGTKLPSWMRPVSDKAFATERQGVYRRVNADSLVGKPWPSPNLYKAAHDIPACWSFDSEVEEILNVKGFVLDTVRQKASAARAGIIPSDWNKIAGWENTSLPPPEAFWRTLVGNRDFESRRPPRHWRKACQDAFSLRTSGGDLDMKESVAYGCPKFVQQYLERVQCTVWSRRLAVLARIPAHEALCLLPMGAKKGDKVCILYGCNVPVLLRDRDASRRCRCECRLRNCLCCAHNHTTDLDDTTPSRYDLIGECYVHGMMDGEALDYKLKNRIKGQNFDIR
ncbi:hypothetical protein GX48_03382 [Paracoccidioides brasiliensis]|nr:hypothetical protein GX48_03382 [Paracoccidioides brasiliensis]